MPTTMTLGARYTALGTDEIGERLEEVRATVGRLHRASARADLAPGERSAETQLSRRVAKFTPSGDRGQDRAALDALERRAVGLLQRATRRRTPA